MEESQKSGSEGNLSSERLKVVSLSQVLIRAGGGRDTDHAPAKLSVRIWRGGYKQDCTPSSVPTPYTAPPTPAVLRWATVWLTARAERVAKSS